LLNGLEHADLIVLSPPKDEQRATEYSKAATRGNRSEVWDNFDLRKGAKAANDVPVEAGDEDMFARAGVAAE
jgi:ribonucleoside-diphosphate reductase beta chain